VGAAGEDGGHRASVGRRRPVADCVDVAVDAVEPPHLRAVVDGICTEARDEELVAGQHPVLWPGESGDGVVDGGCVG
jgi:hypothetical protein